MTMMVNKCRTHTCTRKMERKLTPSLYVIAHGFTEDGLQCRILLVLFLISTTSIDLLLVCVYKAYTSLL